MRCNNVVFGGNLTRDPEIKFLANEKAVTKFTLAYSEKFKTANGEAKEETTFLDVEAWGKTAELCGQYLTKGQPALVIGKLRQETWEDKDGNKRSKIVLRAESVQFGAKRDGGDRPAAGGEGDEDRSQRPTRPAPTRPAPARASADDEPPF